MLRCDAVQAGISDIAQRGDVLRLTLGAFDPRQVAAVCSSNKYRRSLTLSAGETPVLALRLAKGENVLDAALALVEELRLASGQEA